MSDNDEGPDIVMPGPQPFTLQVFEQKTTDGKKVERIVFHTAQGTTIFFLMEEQARWLRDKLTENLGGIQIARDFPR